MSTGTRTSGALERRPDLPRGDGHRAADQDDHAEVDEDALERRRPRLGDTLGDGLAPLPGRRRRDRLSGQDRHPGLPALVVHARRFGHRSSVRPGVREAPTA